MTYRYSSGKGAGKWWMVDKQHQEGCLLWGVSILVFFYTLFGDCMHIWGVKGSWATPFNLGFGWAELMEGYHKLDIDEKRPQPPIWMKIRSGWRVWKSKPWHEKRNITIGFLRSNSFSTRPQKVRPLARPRSLCDVSRWPILPFHSENWHYFDKKKLADITLSKNPTFASSPLL